MLCELPFLPVIVGGSMGHGFRRRPYLIAGALVVSLLVFTVLLKAGTAFLVIDRLGWASNPRGWFQRAIATPFIVVGLLVSTGLDKVLQTWAVDKFPALTAIEQGLIPQSNAVPGVAGNAE